jgi:hypothetical protein
MRIAIFAHRVIRFFARFISTRHSQKCAKQRAEQRKANIVRKKTFARQCDLIAAFYCDAARAGFRTSDVASAAQEIRQKQNPHGMPTLRMYTYYPPTYGYAPAPF